MMEVLGDGVRWIGSWRISVWVVGHLNEYFNWTLNKDWFLIVFLFTVSRWRVVSLLMRRSDARDEVQGEVVLYDLQTTSIVTVMICRETYRFSEKDLGAVHRKEFHVIKGMARMASADIMCVGLKVVREKFSGIISSRGKGLVYFLWGHSSYLCCTCDQCEIRELQTDKTQRLELI
ncbi:hypothetical protein Ccrd_023358, partial [Cynara cardunculus var. scolymus]